MSAPIAISIPHRLGKEEATRRLRTGLSEASARFGQFFSVQEETWTDHHLQFCVAALGQTASGSLDVFEDRVDLVIVLPWLLAKVVTALQPLIRREGLLLLEKK